MFNRMFNTVNLLEKGLDTAALRQEVISHNLANVDTPNYNAKHVEFESMLRSAMEDEGLKGFVTKPGHFKIGVEQPLDVQAVTINDAHYELRMDNNNVDPDQEMLELAENTILFNALTDQVNNEFARLRLAIREGT